MTLQWSPPPPQYRTYNIYSQNLLQAETTITKYKGDHGIETNTDPKTGIVYPYDKEYDFTVRFPINFCGCYICGGNNHFNGNNFPKEIHNHTERTLFFNEIWAHKPHTKKGRKKAIIIAGMGR